MKKGIYSLNFLNIIYPPIYIIRCFVLIILTCIGVSFFSILLNISESYFVKRLVDSALNSSLKEITRYIYIMVGIIFGGLIIVYLFKCLYGYITSKVVYDIKKRIMEHVKKLPVTHFYKYHTGDWLFRLTDDISVIENFIVYDFIDIFLNIGIFLMGSMYLCSISFKLYLACIIIIPLCFVSANLIGNKVKKHNTEMKESIGRSGTVIQDLIKGISIVKSFNAVEMLESKFQMEIDCAYKSSLKIAKILSCTCPIQIFVRVAPFIICIAYGGFLSLKGNLTPGSLLAFITLLDYVLNPISRITDFINILKKVEVACKRLNDIFNVPVELEIGENFEADEFLPVIEFENVTFSYDNEIKVLNNISFSIGKGEKVAFIGESGSGKSTILKLICGFYRCQEGKIKVFGKDINSWGKNALRSHISTVMQDTYLFSSSVLDNIDYGKYGANEVEIVDAARKAYAHEFIEQLANGYHTLVGERGGKFSCGQKQRIALARAILKDSDILLLDEPTSSLDAESEDYICKAFDNIASNKTMLMVTHSISTINNVDKVFIIEQGRIIENRIREELLKESYI